MAKRSRGSARELAPGLCQGSPLRAEIEARAPDRLDEATEAAVAALVRRCGDPVDCAMSAHVFTARAVMLALALAAAAAAGGDAAEIRRLRAQSNAAIEGHRAAEVRRLFADDYTALPGSSGRPVSAEQTEAAPRRRLRRPDLRHLRPNAEADRGRRVRQARRRDRHLARPVAQERRRDAPHRGLSGDLGAERRRLAPAQRGLRDPSLHGQPILPRGRLSRCPLARS